MCVGGEASVTNESSNYSSLGTTRDTPYDVLKIYENTPQMNNKGYAHLIYFNQDYYLSKILAGRVFHVLFCWRS